MKKGLLKQGITLRKPSHGCLKNTNPLKRRRHDDETTDLDADKFEQLYVEWIADCGIALRMATRESFRA